MPEQVASSELTNRLTDRASASIVLRNEAAIPKLRRSPPPNAIRHSADLQQLHRPLQIAVDANSQRCIPPPAVQL
jgi:hypothetical protein